SNAPPQSRMSGTSMAAPNATGVAALLYEASPRPISIEELRALLVDTADAVSDSERHRLGAGYLNPAAAIAAARALAAHPSIHVRPGPPLVPRPQLRLPSAKESEMTISETPIEVADEAFECEADYDAELEADYDAKPS